MVIVVNKEKGYTSRDVVNAVGKILGTKKIGHTGTLDPIACGVLVLCVGKCLKLCELLQGFDKEYVATVVMGIHTDTLDVTGNVLKKSEVRSYTREGIINVLNSFLGESMQEVPIYSAIKVNGKKLYEYARENIEVDLPTRMINVKEIELLDMNGDTFKFRCVVSKGTYIRSLIRDIGVKLGVLTCMKDLTRTKLGNFRIEDSYGIEDIRNGNYNFYNIEDILGDVKKVVMDDELLFKVRNGTILKNEYGADEILFMDGNEARALYRLDKTDGLLKVFKMFL